MSLDIEYYCATLLYFEWNIQCRIVIVTGLAGHRILLRHPGSQDKPLLYTQLPVERLLPSKVHNGTWMKKIFWKCPWKKHLKESSCRFGLLRSVQATRHIDEGEEVEPILHLYLNLNPNHCKTIGSILGSLQCCLSTDPSQLQNSSFAKCSWLVQTGQSLIM